MDKARVDHTGRLDITISDDIAWAAGFFDGEGSVTYRNTKNPHRPNAFVLQLSITQCEKKPLMKFKQALSIMQRVNGPYKRPNRKPYYSLCTLNQSAYDAYEKLLPYLQTKRKEQAKKVMKMWKQYQAHKAHPWDNGKGRKR